MCFYINLKKCREDKGLSQKEVAEMIGVAPSTYSLYEKGTREPDVIKIKGLAKALNVTGDYLLFGTDKPFDNRFILSDCEKSFIEDFRNLSDQGKEYMLQTMDLVKDKYKKDTVVSNVENKIG